ncbi:zinc sigma-54-dependent two-component system [Desulfocucumis palustris]|uniref:Stage 0 sporulation protein A homolog n=1 Tax=Desulfocucumis palustris TaxID=1898651 RepID=A0A2L2XCD2_9FIRM|nr:sigma-54 dependent transcriptional regulator [Desulfocucumis palustris]GBF33997.1 zinc sigma-54-dependent two-component system [Desulfocucumis palustris]
MNILLVEDDRDSREYLAGFLGKHGHAVTECGNGKDALDLINNREFHMVLSDINIPGMSGLDILRSLPSPPPGRYPDVVLFTGYDDVELAIEAIRAGAYDYFLKPINIKELTVVVERVAKHQSLLPENKVLNKKIDETAEAATKETKRELKLLQEAYAQAMGAGEVIIASETMKNIFQLAEKYHADRTIPVLIQGETGTGKEVVARHIHYGKGNTAAPFVDINCAAISPGMFESELFGYEKGTFTGGLPKGKKGKIDLALGGTIFLDEIAELSMDLQAKLLRFIQEKEFYRVGGLKKIKADIRIICATNVNIEESIKKNSFRQDLYYRLNLGLIHIPPLRERKEEIIPLAEALIRQYAQKRKKRFCTISDSASRILLSHHWPGNVRELKNVMEWISFMHDGPEVKPSHLNILTRNKPAGNGDKRILNTETFSLPEGSFNIEEFNNMVVAKALEMHKGNKAQAARYLGISRRMLYCRLERMEKRYHPE